MATELRVPHWIDAQGQARGRLTLAELGGGFKVLYLFQSWCPGCHSHGFPTLKRMVDALAPHGFGFAAIQTVFEGAHVNTAERLREMQLRYGLAIPFGHDAPAKGGRPSVMADYGTRGTPWFIVIDPMGEILHSDFKLDADALIQAFGVASEPLRSAA
jgi:thiol-disulfide isomerase/thioredoxin